MKLTVHKGSGTDIGADVYLGTNVKDDFSDIRFTKNDCRTLLNYCIESYISGTSAIVWIEFDNIAASPATSTFYIFYGNPSATLLSNGTNTFDFFDDFGRTDGNGLGNGWTDSIAADCQISSNTAKLTANTTTSPYNNILIKSFSFSSSQLYMFETSAKISAVPITSGFNPRINVALGVNNYRADLGLGFAFEFRPINSNPYALASGITLVPPIQLVLITHWGSWLAIPPRHTIVISTE